MQLDVCQESSACDRTKHYEKTRASKTPMSLHISARSWVPGGPTGIENTMDHGISHYFNYFPSFVSASCLPRRGQRVREGHCSHRLNHPAHEGTEGFQRGILHTIPTPPPPSPNHAFLLCVGIHRWNHTYHLWEHVQLVAELPSPMSSSS